MTAHSAFHGYEWGYDPAKGADKSAPMFESIIRWEVESNAWTTSAVTMASAPPSHQ